MGAHVAADLRAAADVLKRDGWTQGTYHRPDGCHCVEGAIALVVGQHVRAPEDDENWWESHPEAELLADSWFALQDHAAWRRRNAAEDALSAHVGASQVGGVAAWNDDEDRTADEVTAALRAAADAAEATQ